MAFPLKDVRFTTRRGGDGVVLYPRLMRDRAVLPKVDIAIQYFETMLGGERRELDPEALVHFFGDHKLARCMVASLARSYRYRSRRIEEVVTQGALRRLRRAAIDSPKLLRIRLFDHVNESGDGFLRAAERAGAFGQVEGELGLRAGELERLLVLDAEEHAILTRVGAVPRAADVVAHYNLAVLETLLRHAEEVGLRVRTTDDGRRTTVGNVGPSSVVHRPSSVREAILGLCAANDVDATASVEGRTLRLRLRGRQDALGGWARHGRRLARTVVQLLERDRAGVTEGAATVALRERRVGLRLTDEALDILGGAPAPDAGWDDLEGWGPADLAGATALGRSARLGWSVRRAPDPWAWAAGALVPDLLVREGDRRFLLCAVRSPAHGERLASIVRAGTSGEPLAFIGAPAALAPFEGMDVLPIAQERFDLRAALAELSAAMDAEAPATRVA